MSRAESLKLNHPTCLFVALDKERNEFAFNIPFYPKQSLDLSISKPGRIFTVRRPGKESFAELESRLLGCMNKYFAKSPKAPENVCGGAFLRVTGISLAESNFTGNDKIESIFTSSKSLQIIIGIESAEVPWNLLLDVVMEPASVKSVKLEMLPQVGCPLIPAVVGTNLDFKKSKFQWVLSEVSIYKNVNLIGPVDKQDTSICVYFVF